jgi:hypothetical protein
MTLVLYGVHGAVDPYLPLRRVPAVVPARRPNGRAGLLGRRYPVRADVSGRGGARDPTLATTGGLDGIDLKGHYPPSKLSCTVDSSVLYIVSVESSTRQGLGGAFSLLSASDSGCFCSCSVCAVGWGT